MSTVALSWVRGREVHGAFLDAMLDITSPDSESFKHVAGYVRLASGPRIAEARSQVVDEYLLSTNPAIAASDWLLMIDTDMVPPADLLARMLEIADPEQVPILGTLCFAGGYSRCYPTLYWDVTKDGVWQGLERRETYPKDQLVKVGATGCGCILIHRGVLRALAQPWPNGFGTLQDGRKNPYPWFSEGLVGAKGEPYGEDIAFCRRCAVKGIPVHVHTGIQVGHMKDVELNEDYYRWHLMSGAEKRAEARRRARTP